MAQESCFMGKLNWMRSKKKKLAEFMEYLKTKQNNKYDQEYFTPQLLFAFAYFLGYKYDAAYEAMTKHMEFRAKYIRNSEGIRIIKYETDEKVKKLIDAGFFYVCGRDRSFRPTMVFNLRSTDTSDVDAVLRGIVFVQEEVIEKLFLPGQVECWNVIYDVGGMGITDLPVNALKSSLQTIAANYGGRLYRLWMLNSPATIYFSWKVVKNFLEQVTVDKINIIKKNTDDSLWKIFDKSQIEKKYGGTQPDRKTFYPFQLPEAVVDTERLVSDKKYEEMLSTGFLKNNVIDPKFRKTEETKTETSTVAETNQEQKVEQKSEEPEKTATEDQPSEAPKE